MFDVSLIKSESCNKIKVRKGIQMYGEQQWENSNWLHIFRANDNKTELFIFLENKMFFVDR